VQGGDRADHRGHQQRGGRIAQPELLGDQVAGGGTQREGEQDRQPGEPFAAPRVDAVDGQGLLHRVNVTAKARAKMMVVVCNETPKLSTRLSVMSVPTTLIKTTASQ